MGPEIIAINVGGTQFTAFRLVQVTAALDHAARAFELVAAAEGGAAAIQWQLAPGTAITIMANGDPLLVGYVDRFQPIMSKQSREVKIAGRSKSADLVDGAAIDPKGTGRFENLTVKDIAAALNQFDVDIIAEQMLDPVDAYQVMQGETVHAVMEKLCRAQGLTLAGTADGSLSIAKAGTKRHAGALMEGVNIIEGSADLNWAHRHSKVIVKGQRPLGHGPGALQVEAQAQDTAVTRNRPVIVMAEDDLDQDGAQERADYRIAREAGESLQASVQVQGFRDDAGTVWEPGNLVWLESDFLGITQVTLIKGATFLYSRDSGAVTYLDLCDPQAFGGKAGKGGSKKDPWSSHASRVKPSK